MGSDTIGGMTAAFAVAAALANKSDDRGTFIDVSMLEAVIATMGWVVSNHLIAGLAVTTFDSSLGGLGGCPYAPGATGNIVTEDLVFVLEAMGLRTGVDIDALIAAREVLLHGLPGEVLYGNVPEAGLPKGFAYACDKSAM